MVKNQRSELDIITEILNISINGARKTNILSKSNISYTQIQSYLPFLIKKEVLEECLIEKKHKSYKYYKTTQKGLNLLYMAKKTLYLLK